MARRNLRHVLLPMCAVQVSMSTTPYHRLCQSVPGPALPHIAGRPRRRQQAHRHRHRCDHCMWCAHASTIQRCDLLRAHQTLVILAGPCTSLAQYTTAVPLLHTRMHVAGTRHTYCANAPPAAKRMQDSQCEASCRAGTGPARASYDMYCILTPTRLPCGQPPAPHCNKRAQCACLALRLSRTQNFCS